MNAEHITPFINSAQSILLSVCNMNTAVGQQFLKAAPYNCLGVAISVDVGGGLSGSVIYTLESTTACNLASQMMGGMAVAAIDDMSKSAVEELANMISSTAATAFAGMGLNVSLSVPVLRQNAQPGDFGFIKPDSQFNCVQMSLHTAELFEIDILIT